MFTDKQPDVSAQPCDVFAQPCDWRVGVMGSYPDPAALAGWQDEPRQSRQGTSRAGPSCGPVADFQSDLDKLLGESTPSGERALAGACSRADRQLCCGRKRGR